MGGLLGLLSRAFAPPPPDPLVAALREGKGYFDGAKRAAAIGAAVAIRMRERAEEARLACDRWDRRSRLDGVSDDLRRAANGLADFYERRAEILGGMATVGWETAEQRSDYLEDMAEEHRGRLLEAKALGHDVTGLGVTVDARQEIRNALQYIDVLGLQAEVAEEVDAALRALPEAPREWDERLTGRAFERLESGQ